MKLFGLKSQDISKVLSVYGKTLCRNPDSFGRFVKGRSNRLKNFEKFIDNKIKSRELTHKDLKDLYWILLILARRPSLYRSFVRNRFGICLMIMKVYQSRPYTRENLTVLEMEII
ncbi:hypothetical protein [Pseudomonas fluorescens]